MRPPEPAVATSALTVTARVAKPAVAAAPGSAEAAEEGAAAEDAEERAAAEDAEEGAGAAGRRGIGHPSTSAKGGDIRGSDVIVTGSSKASFRRDDGSVVGVAAARVQAAGRGDPPLPFYRVFRKANPKRARALRRHAGHFP